MRRWSTSGGRPSALEHALVKTIKPDLVGRMPYGQTRLRGVVGWGALTVEDPATPANRTAWAPWTTSTHWRPHSEADRRVLFGPSCPLMSGE